MLKHLLIIFSFVLTIHVSYGQTYTGTQSNSLKRYNCLLRINKDSTINFIYDRDNNCVYGEHYGKIYKLNDSIYRISATMVIGQFYMKSFYEDTIYIQLDSTLAHQLDKITITYTNGTTINLVGYDISTPHVTPIPMLKVPVNKKVFNNSKGSDYISITINRKNLVTGEFLNFRIPYGSAASFTRGYKVEFEVLIKNGILRTIGNPPIQTGHFDLKLKSSP